jgi:hypothetical protein
MTRTKDIHGEIKALEFNPDSHIFKREEKGRLLRKHYLEDQADISSRKKG